MSKIIKSLNTVPVDNEVKTINIRNLFENNNFKPMRQEDEQGDEQDQLPSKEELAKQIEEQLQEAEKRATQIIVDAEAHAKDIRELLQLERQQAEKQIEEAIVAGREQGYQEGFVKGQQDGEQTYMSLIDQAKTIISQSEFEFEKTIDSAEPVMIDLAVALTKRIIGKHLEDNPDNWSSLLKQVMLEVREHEHVKIYVHPDWYMQTTQQKEELEQLLSHTEKLYIYPDAGLMENGCVVETQYGRIDATLDRQLQELKTLLIEKWKEGPNERSGTH